MLMLPVDIETVSESPHLLGRLLLDLFLNTGKIHRNVSPVSKAQRLDYMNEMKLSAIVISDGTPTLHYRRRVLAEVNGDQNVFVLGHRLAPL